MLTLYEVKLSRIPAVLGLCSDDLVRIASYINEAQQRLIQAAGETGWVGGWARMAFNTTRSNPLITAPRNVVRLIDIDVCRAPIRLQNEFFEFLEFGVGLQRSNPSCSPTVNSHCQVTQAFDRGFVPLLNDLTPGNTLRVYMANVADKGLRIFFNGIDINGMQIYSVDNGVRVNGFFLSFDSPFVDSPMALNSITGILKDKTFGPISVYQVDPSGNQSLLTIIQPDQQTTSYRRYFLQALPTQCFDCDSPTGIVQVQALAKLEFIPVASDTDFLIIQNIAALKEECMAIRAGEMDSAEGKRESILHHKEAIKLLNQELIHVIGKTNPAIQFKPWGNSSLELQGVGQM